MKWKVKVGTAFEVSFESKKPAEKSAKINALSTAVLAVFVFIGSSAGYGAATGDYTVFNAALEAIVKCCTAMAKKT